MIAARLRGALAALVLMLVPFVLYRPAMHGELQVDDYRFIAWNGPHLEHWAGPWRYFADPSTSANVPDPDIYRPLRTWSFAIDRRLFGDDTFGYHLHSIVLHALVALLAWRLFAGTFPGRPGAAFTGALVFAAHPLATEAVAWISGRSDAQAAVFALLALVAARRAERSRPALIAAFACAGLAGFAKETAVVVPLLYVLEARARRAAWRTMVPSFLALATGVAGYLAAYVAVRGGLSSGQVEFYGGSFAIHAPFGLVGVATLLRLCVWPTGFNFYHEPELYIDAPHLRPIGLGIALFVLAIVIVVPVALRRRAPSLGFGSAWFVVAILPAANLVLPLRTVVSERFAYLPLVGLAAGAAVAVAAFTEGRVPRAILVALALAVVGAFGGLTWARAGEWASRERLYLATLDRFPGSFAANYGLASVRFEAGRYPEAELAFARAASAVDGSRPGIPADFGRFADARLGQATSCFERRDFTSVVTLLAPVEQRLTADPASRARVRDDTDLSDLLGRALLALRRLDEARGVYERIVRDHGESPRWLDGLGLCAHLRLDAATALDLYQRALEIDPNYHLARIHMAEIFHLTPGMEREGLKQLREVLAREPDHPQARALLEEWLREK